MSTQYQHIRVYSEADWVHVELDRPAVRNAINAEMIFELQSIFEEIQSKKTARGVCMTGHGPHFCSGADLNWMKSSLRLSEEENKKDADMLYTLFHQIETCFCPVIAGVHGVVPGGAVGLVAACDYVIALNETRFSLSEVRLGIIPAIIAPFLLKKINMSWLRALFLTAKPFLADRACQIGLVHEVVETRSDMRHALSRLKSDILAASPQAIITAKRFLTELVAMPASQRKAAAVETLATIRVSKEGQEGISAFLEKRLPNWRQ